MRNRIIEKPVAELYRRIHMENLDGQVQIQDAQFTKALYFRNGRLDFARTTVIQERLGEILYKLGKINQTQFWDLHKMMEGRKDRLGQVLIQARILDNQTLALALAHQVMVIATNALTLTSGAWEYSPDPADIPEDSRLAIPIPRVIAAAMPRLTNLAYFRNRFFEKNPRRLPLDQSILAGVDSNTRQLYERLADLSAFTCGELDSKINWATDTVWNCLTHLYLINGLEFTDPVREDGGIDLNVESMLNLFQRINSGSTDHYAILGLKDTATNEEIKNAYFRLAKQLHPDRLGTAPDPEIREKANFVFAAINKAFDTLNDPQRKRAYDSGETDEDGAADRTPGNLKERARLLYLKARTLYSQQRFWEAATLMDEAVGLDNDKSAYYLLLGMAQFHIPSLRRSAERNLTRAVELDPWNADAFSGLGILFQEEQLNNRAEGFYRKALSINPDHKIARRRLEQISGGAAKKHSFFGKKK
ncbi:MAG: DnaJ domain-containing protein [Acidobacteriota bacterium]|jgi:curved DNA-binding protein CbpA|nr:DnaJ domain-containing protein [Acidobacteriota bacterium]